MAANFPLVDWVVAVADMGGQEQKVSRHLVAVVQAVGLITTEWGVVLVTSGEKASLGSNLEAFQPLISRVEAICVVDFSALQVTCFLLRASWVAVIYVLGDRGVQHGNLEARGMQMMQTVLVT